MIESWAKATTEKIAQILYDELSFSIPAHLRRPWDELDDRSKLAWRSIAVAVVNGLGDLAPHEVDDVNIENFTGSGKTLFRYCTTWLSQQEA